MLIYTKLINLYHYIKYQNNNNNNNNNFENMDYIKNLSYETIFITVGTTEFDQLIHYIDNQGIIIIYY